MASLRCSATPHSYQNFPWDTVHRYQTCSISTSQDTHPKTNSYSWHEENHMECKQVLLYSALTKMISMSEETDCSWFNKMIPHALEFLSISQIVLLRHFWKELTFMSLVCLVAEFLIQGKVHSGNVQNSVPAQNAAFSDWIGHHILQRVDEYWCTDILPYKPRPHSLSCRFSFHVLDFTVWKGLRAAAIFAAF